MNSVEIQKEFDDAIFYKTSCDCMDSGDDLSLFMEYDKEFHQIILHMCYRCLCSDGWTGWKRYTRRLEKIWQMFWRGYIETEGCFIFQGEKQIDDIIEALKHGKKKLKKVQDNDQEK